MRIALAVYLAVAQAFGSAMAVSPTPPEFAEFLTAQLSAQIMEREVALWSALQRRDRDAWVALLPRDYRQVNSDGTLADRDSAFDWFANSLIQGYSTHYLRGALILPNVFVVTYSIARKQGSANQLPITFTACSVWAKRNGTWLKIHYQETPMVQRVN
jgi:hypothetical protein